MNGYIEYIILAVFVLGINVVPAFMPPTWTILVFFFLTYHLLPVPVVIIGAVFATLGRIALYFLSKYQIVKILPEKSKKNMEFLGKYFYENKKITVPALLIYAFMPVPSNQAYIAAGLAKVHIKIVATLFFCGRLISYSSWILTAHLANSTLSDVFKSYFSKGNVIILELLGFGIIYLISTINWARILKRRNK